MEPFKTAIICTNCNEVLDERDEYWSWCDYENETSHVAVRYVLLPVEWL